MVIDLASLAGKIYRVEELAEALGMHADSVRRVIRSGALEATRPAGGRAYFVTGDAVIRYLTGGPKAGPRPTKARAAGKGKRKR